MIACWWRQFSAAFAREGDAVEFGNDFSSSCKDTSTPSFTSPEMATQHQGGCHCRRVRYKVTAPASVVAWDCNCSDCAMRRNVHFVVPQRDFKLEESSREYLTLYTFGTHTAKHYFCKVCGITSFYIPRSNPDGVAVTVNCVDAGTLSHVEVKTFDGQNWEASFEDSGIAAASKRSATTVTTA